MLQQLQLLLAGCSSLQTVADLRTAAEADSIEFLFVHPLSTSGRAAPEEALRRVGIEIQPSRTSSKRSGEEQISRSGFPTCSLLIHKEVFECRVGWKVNSTDEWNITQ